MESLIFSLILLKKKKKKEQYDSTMILNFIEILLCQHFISENDFGLVINFIPHPPESIFCHVFYLNFDHCEEESEQTVFDLDSIKREKLIKKKKDDDEYEEDNLQDKNKKNIDNNQNNIIKAIKNELTIIKKGFKGNCYSQELKKFASLIYFSSKYSYCLTRELVNFPCEKKIHTFTKPYLDSIEKFIF